MAKKSASETGSLKKEIREKAGQLQNQQAAYKDFTARLKLLISKNPHLITTTLSNIFTMRLIGNKTHGDLAEIAIAEFINQFMYDFKSIHVGKDLYRAKKHEEDIKVINEITKEEFTVSLKAYGHGPLQLSTDKTGFMFMRLKEKGVLIKKVREIAGIWKDPVFAAFDSVNVLPLIYDEKQRRCNLLVFNVQRAKAAVTSVQFVETGKRRKHPVYRFYDCDGGCICEVRYGGGTANALQRGLWTHTKNSFKYFDSLTEGWIDYSQNKVLVHLFSHALIATAKGHEAALEKLKEDIEEQKKHSKLK
ncbi:MAG TPA: hypothetical protein VFV23_10115 [Verrucomicrobiae bacterium]|nr:hypothetical protein [Verrucomicrobiae bacterium]